MPTFRSEPSANSLTDDRVALISGASRGIGAAIAHRLNEEGWQLSLGMRRPELPEWSHSEERLQCVAYDAQAENSEQRWVDKAVARFGRIDAVIANAGVMVPKSVLDVEDDELDAMWELNVKAPRRLIKAAWPQLLMSASGRVVVLASLAGKRVPSATSSAYALTKHAAVALAHGIRHTGWASGVRATALCPGLVATDMARQITDRPAEEMTSPVDIARLASLALNLPNEASVAELHVNCMLGEHY